MKVLATSLGVAASVALLSSSASLSQELNFVGCRAGGNGMAKISEHVGPAATTRIARTRRGDNGKGNGGESWDVYLIREGGELVEIRFVCISTADEDTTGTRYLVVDGGVPVDIGPGGINIEFDPVRP